MNFNSLKYDRTSKRIMVRVCCVHVRHSAGDNFQYQIRFLISSSIMRQTNDIANEMKHYKAKIANFSVKIVIW